MAEKKVHEVLFFFLSHRHISTYFPLAYFGTSQTTVKIQRKTNQTYPLFRSTSVLWQCNRSSKPKSLRAHCTMPIQGKYWYLCPNKQEEGKSVVPDTSLNIYILFEIATSQVVLGDGFSYCCLKNS